MTTTNTSSIFGIHAAALSLRQERMQTIASNLANADTPGYKAQDLDFATALRAATGTQDRERLGLAGTSPQHINADTVAAGMPTRFERPSLQPSLDGNTVDTQIEEAAFAQSALEYRTSLSFVESRMRSLMLALTGQ